jgi:hypothetical protein
MEISDLHEKLVQHAADNAAKFSELNSKIEGTEMSEKIEINSASDPAMMMAAMAGRGGGDGLFGGNGGGGVLGGVLLASLLGRNGGLLGGDFN